MLSQKSGLLRCAAGHAAGMEGLLSAPSFGRRAGHVGTGKQRLSSDFANLSATPSIHRAEVSKPERRRIA
ncbi:MAG: hypothetical protein K1X67_15265 [Fimbriimonadaceae bacterium]|nr:hypothetical protein [Fimbriimonadaceae bacterium]